jgi:hypothetical protein
MDNLENSEDNVCLFDWQWRFAKALCEPTRANLTGGSMIAAITILSLLGVHIPHVVTWCWIALACFIGGSAAWKKQVLLKEALSRKLLEIELKKKCGDEMGALRGELSDRIATVSNMGHLRYNELPRDDGQLFDRDTRMLAVRIAEAWEKHWTKSEAQLFISQDNFISPPLTGWMPQVSRGNAQRWHDDIELLKHFARNFDELLKVKQFPP